MKRTIYEADFVRAFDDCGRGDQFSREGRKAIFEYIIDLETGGEPEFEFDVIGICCAFAEYDSREEAAEDLGRPLEDLDSETLEIPGGGIIVCE